MILTKGKESLLWQAARAVKYFIRNCTVQRRLWREDIERHVADSYSGDMPRTTNSEKEVIVMLDGKMQHGGISDRLRGIVSVYSICKEMGIRFRIHFVSPFPLEEFLEPSAVDWRIDPAEISYNSEDSLPIYCGTDYPLVDRPFQRKWLRDNFGKDVRQIHVYTNAFLVRGSAFRAHFDELFKMSPVLRQSIDRLRQEIEPKYIAITTRFQSLLGDFKEGNCQALGEADRLRLMQAAAVEVEKIHQRYGGGFCSPLTA